MNKSYLYRIAIAMMFIVCSTIAMAQNKTHTIARGETLQSIAAKYGVTEEAIRKANPNMGNMFYVGMKLTIPKASAQIVQGPQNQQYQTTNSLYQQNEQPVYTSAQSREIVKENAATSDKYEDYKYFLIEYNPGVFSPESDESQSYNAFSIGLRGYVPILAHTPIYAYVDAVKLQYSFYNKKDGGIDTSFKMLSGIFSLGLGYGILVPNSKVLIMPKAGLNLIMHVYGQIKTEMKAGGKTETHKVNPFSEYDMSSKEKWNWFNVGGHIGLDIHVSKQFMLGFSYQWGFTKIHSNTHMNQANITLGFCI